MHNRQMNSYTNFAVICYLLNSIVLCCQCLANFAIFLLTYIYNYALYMHEYIYIYAFAKVVACIKVFGAFFKSNFLNHFC